MSGTTLGLGAGDAGKDAKRQSVSDWEKDRHYPKADQLRIICLKLGVSADHLIFGDLASNKDALKVAGVVHTLTEDTKRALLALMMGDAVSDKEVEAKMPVTKLKKESGN